MMACDTAEHIKPAWLLRCRVVHLPCPELKRKKQNVKVNRSPYFKSILATYFNLALTAIK